MNVLPMLLKQCSRYPLLVALALLLTFSAVGIHGFSLPMWHDFIDGTPHGEVLAGKARGVRSDDWAVTLPAAIAQTAANPSFPVENPNIGLNQNMLMVGRVPAGSWQILARPETWGFLVGVDFGLAWAWWLPILCLFCGAYLFAMRYAQGSIWFSLSAALFLVFAPFFQFWSFNTALPFAMALFCIEILARLLGTRQPLATLAWGILLGYAGAIFILSGYPPVLVALGYFTLASATVFIQRPENAESRKGLLIKAAGLLLALAVCGLLVGGVLRDALPMIDALRHSEYPGQRFELGGGVSILRIFSNLVFASKNVARWDVLGNVCESAAFLYLFPVVLLAALWRTETSDGSEIRAQRRMMWAYMAGIIGFLGWMTVGFPAPLAKVSLLHQLPPTRAHAALGMFDWALTVVVLGTFKNEEYSPAGPFAKKFFTATFLRLGLGLTLWLLLLAGVANDLWTIAGVAPLRMATLASGWILVAFLILRGRKTAIIVAAAVAIAMTGHFNPLVLGGRQFLFENPLAKMMVEISARFPGEKWVVVRDREVLGNYPRLLGLPGLNGTHFSPQLGIWRQFDPASSQTVAYNRYARVVIDTQKDTPPRFEVPKPDSFTLVVDPRHPGFRMNQARLFLVEGPAPEFAGEDFQLLGTAAGKSVYRLQK